MFHEERFWKNVDKRGPDECWLWTGAVNGYGVAIFYAGRTGPVSAMKYTWWATHPTEFPEEFKLEHTCGTKLCCNPAHIRLKVRKRARTTL